MHFHLSSDMTLNTHAVLGQSSNHLLGTSSRLLTALVRLAAFRAIQELRILRWEQGSALGRSSRVSNEADNGQTQQDKWHCVAGHEAFHNFQRLLTVTCSRLDEGHVLVAGITLRS